MSRSIHLGLGAIAATAAVALAPSTASAASCTFNPNNARELRVQMVTNQIVVQNVNGQIVIGEPGGSGFACTPRSSIDKMVIRSANPPGFDRVIVDESLGRFNGLQIIATTGTGADNMVVNGTNFPDQYAVMPGLGAEIDLGNDHVADFRSSTVGTITINGNGGKDFIAGQLFDLSGRLANQRLDLRGGAGDDVLNAGGSGRDVIDGGTDHDIVKTGNGKAGDVANGGPGGDTIIADAGDILTGFEAGGIGGPKPGSVRVQRGETEDVRLAWSHPVDWKRLSSVTLSAYRGATKVGAVELAPRTGRVTASGAVKVAGHGPLSRKGKKVSVNLKLKFADRLDGDTLDLRTQVEDRGMSGR